MQVNRRLFLRRAAGAGLALGASVVAPWQVGRAFARPADTKTFNVCLISGSEEYKSNDSLAAFQGELEKSTPARCSRAFWKSKTNVPGLEALDTADLMIVFTKRLELPDEQLDRVKRYCASGRPIIGLRTASHAFQNWLELDSLVFGGSYSGHYKSGIITKVEAVKGAADHPILSGFRPIETPTKLYKNRKNAEDTTLLLTGTIPEETEPLAWTRDYNGARVFYTSLGGPDDFANDTFRTMLTNAIYWAVDRKR